MLPRAAMACGMTPQLMEMIAKMQRGEHVPGMSPEPAPPAAKPRAARPAAHAPAGGTGGGGGAGGGEPAEGWDWTRKYDAWDKWEVRRRRGEGAPTAAAAAVRDMHACAGPC